MLRKLIVSLLLAGVLPGVVSAAPITMQFTATGFVPDGPDATVSGTIRWEAASIHSPVQQFTSIALTIAGVPYSVQDIVFTTAAGDPNDAGISGTPNFAVATNTRDFAVGWLLDSLTPTLFAYSVVDQNNGGPFFALAFSSFSITADGAGGTNVPEPATGALLGLALGGLAMIRRRAC